MTDGDKASPVLPLEGALQSTGHRCQLATICVVGCCVGGSRTIKHPEERAFREPPVAACAEGREPVLERVSAPLTDNQPSQAYIFLRVIHVLDFAWQLVII